MGKRRREEKEYPVVDLDIPLGKLPSLGLPLDSTSESEADGHRRRKHHKSHAKRHRRASVGDVATRPTPMGKRPKMQTAVSAGKDAWENARAQKQAKVLQVVEK